MQVSALSGLLIALGYLTGIAKSHVPNAVCKVLEFFKKLTLST